MNPAQAIYKDGVIWNLYRIEKKLIADSYLSDLRRILGNKPHRKPVGLVIKSIEKPRRGGGNR